MPSIYIFGSKFKDDISSWQENTTETILWYQGRILIIMDELLLIQDGINHNLERGIIINWESPPYIIWNMRRCAGSVIIRIPHIIIIDDYHGLNNGKFDIHEPESLQKSAALISLICKKHRARIKHERIKQRKLDRKWIEPQSKAMKSIMRAEKFNNKNLIHPKRGR